LHMRRELIPPVPLTDAEIKAGGDIAYGKRGKETQSEYQARRAATVKHRDEYRWWLDNSNATKRFEGKEILENSGQYMAVFPPEVAGGPMRVARLDAWIDMRRWVDLSAAKQRAAENVREDQLRKARRKNLQSAVDKVVGRSRKQRGDDEEYRDPDLEVDHEHDLAIDRQGLDNDDFGDFNEEAADDDEDAEELVAGEDKDGFKEGLNDVVPQVLDSEDERENEDEDGEGGRATKRQRNTSPYTSSSDDEDDDVGGGDRMNVVEPSSLPLTALPSLSIPALPLVRPSQSMAKRVKVDPLTEAVVNIIRTNQGRIKQDELMQRLKRDTAKLDQQEAIKNVAAVLARVTRKVVNAVDGEMITLKDEWQ
jgi:hypothetical protein